MKKYIHLLLALYASAVFAADVKISQLSLNTASSTVSNDSFPYVNSVTSTTQRLTLYDLINVPAIKNTFAPLLNPTFTGIVTAPTFVGALTGTATGNLTHDSNNNLSLNNFIGAENSVTTAGTTTTLTVASAFQQYFTGSTTQTVVMPVTSTLTLGQSFIITNTSSGVVTVQSSGSNTILAMAANSQVTLTCVSTSLNTAAAWNISSPGYIAGNVVAGATGLSNSNVVFSNSPSFDAITKYQATAGSQILLNHGGTGWGVIGNVSNGLWGIGYSNTGNTTFDNKVWQWNNTGTVQSLVGEAIGFTTTATAGATTTMTIASTQLQVWTGSTTQTISLPTTSVLQGQRYIFVNLSTGALSLQSSGLNAITTVSASSRKECYALVATPTTAANWSCL